LGHLLVRFEHTNQRNSCQNDFPRRPSLSKQILEELASAVEAIHPDKVIALSRLAVDSDMDPVESVENGIARGLREVGVKHLAVVDLLAPITAKRTIRMFRKIIRDYI